jgi:hypothetical protein
MVVTVIILLLLLPCHNCSRSSIRLWGTSNLEPIHSSLKIQAVNTV